MVFQRKDVNEIQRMCMVEEQIIRRGIKDEKVLDALRLVERHCFVPQDMRHKAYQDCALPIGYGQTISQPYMVAVMTEQLSLSGKDKVLEIGTGSGYQTAVLAKLAREVYSVEIIEELYASAVKKFADIKADNIFVNRSDGYQGWAAQSPFDAIIVTAAPEEIPQNLVNQLAENGRMILPVGNAGPQKLLKVTKSRDGVLARELMDVQFVPMVHNS